MFACHTRPYQTGNLRDYLEGGFFQTEWQMNEKLDAQCKFFTDAISNLERTFEAKLHDAIRSVIQAHEYQVSEASKMSKTVKMVEVKTDNLHSLYAECRAQLDALTLANAKQKLWEETHPIIGPSSSQLHIENLVSSEVHVTAGHMMVRSAKSTCTCHDAGHGGSQIHECLSEAAATLAKTSTISGAVIAEGKMPKMTQKKVHQFFHHDTLTEAKDIPQKVPANASGTAWFFIGSPEPEKDDKAHEINQGEKQMQRQRCECADEFQNMD